MWNLLRRTLGLTSMPQPSDSIRELRGSGLPIRWETGRHSRRFAAEEALREYQSSTKGNSSREVQDAFIHLIVGRGFSAGR